MNELKYPSYEDNADIEVLNDIFRELKTAVEALETHANDIGNPHDITKEQVGLGNVLNEKQATATEFQNLKEQVNNMSGVVYGTYVSLQYSQNGGLYEAFINLGFTPSVVEVTLPSGSQCYSNGEYMKHYGGIALKNHPCEIQCYYDDAQSVRHNEIIKFVEIAENGFWVRKVKNDSGNIYNFMDGLRYFVAYKNCPFIEVTKQSDGSGNIGVKVTE